MNSILFTDFHVAIDEKKLEKPSLYLRQAEKILALNPQQFFSQQGWAFFYGFIEIVIRKNQTNEDIILLY